jgi:hypothetical protein
MVLSFFVVGSSLVSRCGLGVGCAAVVRPRLGKWVGSGATVVRPRVAGAVVVEGGGSGVLASVARP